MHVDSRMHLCGILPGCWPKFQELELQRPDDLQHFVITEQVEGTHFGTGHAGATCPPLQNS